ncbi:MAG: helix-turn-helix domain-containing protein [Bifidobacterium sp.]
MVEFKRCIGSLIRILLRLYAFRQSFGGSIYLGVDDDGQVLGVDSAR